MLESQNDAENYNFDLSFYGYYRHYRFQLEEYLKKGVEEFDSNRKVMSEMTKNRIEEEIQRIDFLLNTISKYNYNMKTNHE